MSNRAPVVTFSSAHYVYGRDRYRMHWYSDLIAMQQVYWTYRQISKIKSSGLDYGREMILIK